MHNYKRLSILFAFSLILACGDAASDNTRKDGFGDKPLNREDSLHHAVMEGHDVGMAKMGRLRKFLTQVQQKLDSLRKLPAAQQDKQYTQALTGLQQELQKADQGMTVWMEQYNNDSARNDPQARIQYLESEKQKVTLVKDQILQSLQKADSLLKRP